MQEQAQQSSERLSLDREPLSAFVVCFNEEENIENCLRSLSFCDEVIVIDSFSTDATVELAKKLGVTVIQNSWEGYRAQKAFGLSQVRYEWVLNLDADERVTAELRDSILRVLTGLKSKDSEAADVGDVVGYYINRVVFFLGRWWRRGGWYPEYRLRLFKKSEVDWGGVEPHERPIAAGRTKRLKGEIEHYTYRSLSEQFRQHQRFSTISAREAFKAGKRSSALMVIINPLIRFVKFYLFKHGYREGMAGLVVALAEAYYTFMKYAKLWEYQYNSKVLKSWDAEGNDKER